MSGSDTGKLPAWRLGGGIIIFGAMAVVLLLLAPVYMENLRLGWYMRDLAKAPASLGMQDETLRGDVLRRARQLDLPVGPGDLTITHSGGGLRMEAKYRVVEDFGLYQVDVHFHPAAASWPVRR